MNKQRGFLRLTLILSILVSISAGFAAFPYRKYTNLSYFPPGDEERIYLKVRNNRTGMILSFWIPDNMRHSYEKEFDKIFQTAKHNPAVYKIEYSFAGWKHFPLAIIIGFASVWALYAFIRWVIAAFIIRRIVIGFIVGGFKSK